jgi:hypothetical protein
MLSFVKFFLSHVCADHSWAEAAAGHDSDLGVGWIKDDVLSWAGTHKRFRLDARFAVGSKADHDVLKNSLPKRTK